jgi:hypothetical protein
MWDDFSINPDRLVFFGCMFCGLVVVVMNIS